MKIVSFLVLWLICPVAVATIDAYPFPDETLQVRYHEIIARLRCPQCLNTNIAGSDAMIARDLRREVHRLLLEGESDEAILDFMHQRYGDFILYKPRLTAGTWLLWFGPLVFLGIAGLILVIIVRHRKGVITPDVDRSRLDTLLAKHHRDQG